MSWFQSRGRSTKVARARLSLESLDGRAMADATPIAPVDPGTFGVYGPSTVAPVPTSPVAAVSPTPVGTPTAPAPSASAPVITSFTAVEMGPGRYRFTGTVTAQHPEGMIISFGGEPSSLAGKTATVEADGTFNVLIVLKTDGTDDGTATAVCHDANGTSNVAMTYVTPSH